jgi:uncharacterized membrane protein YgcG
MKKILISTFVATALFLSFATPATAVYIPYIPPSYSDEDDYVSIPDLPAGSHLVDNVDILSSAEEEELETLLETLETDKNVDAAILTVFTHGNDESIVDYSRRAAGTWELGSEINNRGIIIVVAMSERRIRLAVGSGLQESITEEDVQSIITDDISPELSDGNFLTALTNGVNKIEELAAPYEALSAAEAAEQEAATRAENAEYNNKVNSVAEDAGWSAFGNVIVIIVGIFVVTAIFIIIAGLGAKKKLEKLKAKHEQNILAARKEAKNFYNMLSFSDKDKLAAASPTEKVRILTAKLEEAKAKGKSHYSGDVETFVDTILKTSTPVDSSSKFSNTNEPDLIDKALAAKNDALRNKTVPAENKKKHVKKTNSNESHETKENKGFKGFDNDSFTSGGFDVDEKLSNFSSFKDSKFNDGKSTSGF